MNDFFSAFDVHQATMDSSNSEDESPQPVLNGARLSKRSPSVPPRAYQIFTETVLQSDGDLSAKELERLFREVCNAASLKEHDDESTTESKIEKGLLTAKHNRRVGARNKQLSEIERMLTKLATALKVSRGEAERALRKIKVNTGALAPV